MDDMEGQTAAPVVAPTTSGAAVLSGLVAITMGLFVALTL